VLKNVEKKVGKDMLEKRKWSEKVGWLRRMVSPLHVVEVLITLTITIIFDPKKLHISVKCFIISVVSFFVAFAGRESVLNETQLGILFTIHALLCYSLALFISKRYGRSMVDPLCVLFAAIIGLGLFYVYTNYVETPIASVPVHWKEMQGKGGKEGSETDEEEKYLQLIRQRVDKRNELFS